MEKENNLSYCLFVHLVVSRAGGWESRTRQTNPPLLALQKWLLNCLWRFPEAKRGSGSALWSRKTPFPTVQTPVCCLFHLRSHKPWFKLGRALSSPTTYRRFCPFARLARPPAPSALQMQVYDTKTGLCFPRGHSSQPQCRGETGNNWEWGVPEQDVTPGLLPARPARAPHDPQMSRVPLQPPLLILSPPQRGRNQTDPTWDPVLVQFCRPQISSSHEKQAEDFSGL